jgi:hypothetical protein
MLDYVALGDRGRGQIQTIGVGLWRMFIDDFVDFRPDVMEVWENIAKKTAFVSTINRGIQKKGCRRVPTHNKELAASHIFILVLRQ